MVEVRQVTDPADFLTSATPLLLSDEARNNLILGLAGTLRDRPGFYPDFRLWIVEDRAAVVGCALQTPPFNLVLAQPSIARACAVLADEIAAEGTELPGVVAALPEADLFADAWEIRRGSGRTLRRAQRIYRLTTVRPRPAVSGRARVATEADLELLVEWVRAFSDEISTDVPSPVANSERVVDARLRDAQSGFMLWEDDGPVSVAGWGGPTPNGIRIGPVYTPPDLRSRGYGSAVTAAVSEAQLAVGRRFCFLYTDLANPTSNKIYMDIGYEPVCDAVDYAFEPRPAS